MATSHQPDHHQTSSNHCLMTHPITLGIPWDPHLTHVPQPLAQLPATSDQPRGGHFRKPPEKALGRNVTGGLEAKRRNIWKTWSPVNLHGFLFKKKNPIDGFLLDIVFYYVCVFFSWVQLKEKIVQTCFGSEFCRCGLYSLTCKLDHPRRSSFWLWDADDLGLPKDMGKLLQPNIF